jgi:ABC-type transport system involved in multi-copper enzyme maturation permease subunit
MPILAVSVERFKIQLITVAIFAIVTLIFSYRDFLRFSLKRAWAISGVCFAESIRRRVLLITPLAILGIIIISQLQRPLDEQDAIRTTIKFCIFATALVVTITTVILACTNLPREIENRVIFTVVTKPTTRLEIVVGKVIG